MVPDGHSLLYGISRPFKGFIAETRDSGDYKKLLGTSITLLKKNMR